MYTMLHHCRACGFGQPTTPEGIKAQPNSEKLIPVLNLGVQPLANDFRSAHEERAGFAPLQVLYCPRCTLGQLSVVVRPEILYSRYSYVTSPSQTMREHFKAIVTDILRETEPGAVVEIGSNDGLLLAFLSDNGFGNVVGIDPAKNLAEKANKAGIMTVNDFFSDQSAEMARDMAGRPDLVIARHVFCHVNDWKGFMKSMAVLAGEETLIAIEVPYVVDQIQAGSFDQIYHEHLSYLSVHAVAALLKHTPFHIHRIEHYPIHGGALLIMLRHNESKMQPHQSVNAYLETECVSLNFWRDFARASELRIVELGQKVRELASHGKRICGYGASAKSTVWINAAGLTRKEIQFICDSTREKVYCSSPGSEIPIVHEGEHFTQCMDYAILWAWNYRKEIIERERNFRNGGGKWIIPVPELEIV